jgi:hypothetical protein
LAGLPAGEPTVPPEKPALQRSVPELDARLSVVAGRIDCCGGTGAPLPIGGFGRLRSSSVPLATSVAAFAPASTRTVPEFDTDLTGELETVAAPQAAVSSAAATRRTRS